MKEIYNQLYWLVEDLKSFTDLSSNRFDLDDAKKLLWKMIPILKEHELPKIQNLFDVLDLELSHPPTFDKISFSEKIDELFQLMENKRNEK